MPCPSSIWLRGPKLSVSSGVPQHRGVHAGRDTYTNPVPTADRGTPSPAPCPHLRVSRHPLDAPATGRDSRVGESLASPGCSALATSPGWPDSGFSLVKAPPRVLACLPQRRSVRRRPLPQELRRTGQPTVGTVAAPRIGIPGWHRLCPTDPIIAGSSGQHQPPLGALAKPQHPKLWLEPASSPSQELVTRSWHSLLPIYLPALVVRWPKPLGHQSHNCKPGTPGQHRTWFSSGM